MSRMCDESTTRSKKEERTTSTRDERDNNARTQTKTNGTTHFRAFLPSRGRQSAMILVIFVSALHTHTREREEIRDKTQTGKVSSNKIPQKKKKMRDEKQPTPRTKTSDDTNNNNGTTIQTTTLRSHPVLDSVLLFSARQTVTADAGETSATTSS